MSTRPKRLLLIEDNPAHARLMQIQFAAVSGGLHVDWVPDGESALSFIRGLAPYIDRVAPDLVLLDLGLPGISGFDVLSALKQDERLKLIPVVVISNSEQQQDLVRAYRDAANAYVVKPANLDELRRVVQDTVTFWCLWNQAPKPES